MENIPRCDFPILETPIGQHKKIYYKTYTYKRFTIGHSFKNYHFYAS